MLIKQKNVRSVDRFLPLLEELSEFCLAVRVRSRDNGLLQRVGFASTPVHGQSVLPAETGPVARFNSEGRYIERKDLPKEARYITTIEWEWKQWCGRNQTETVVEHRDIYRDCYQRDFIEPPALELTLVETDGEPLVVSPAFSSQNIDLEQLKHSINLFLELFGECEIRRSDLTVSLPAQAKRVSWEILPPGAHPWATVKRHVEKQLANRHRRYSNVILQRQESIAHFKPDEVYVGIGGFRSYIAYVFSSKKLVVLESMETANATYVFGEDWQEFSQLTKAEILDRHHQKDRLIHSKGWQQRLERLLAPESQLSLA